VKKTRKVRRLVWLGLCLAAHIVSGKGLFSLKTAGPDGMDAGQDPEILDLLHRHGRAPISISRKKMLPCGNLSALLLKKKIFIVCP